MKSLPYLSLLLASPSALAAEPDAAKLFHEQVAPILVKNCVECHNDVTTKGGLNMATLADVLKGGDDGPSIVPGKAAESSLYTMIVPESAGEKPEMPKKKPSLSTAETDLIKRWIDLGAAWPSEIVLKEKPKGDITHWSLLPLKASAAHSSIDAFITAKLQEKNLTLNPPADARTFIRRASFDLIGL
ncbi:MAG: Planctomycete cytochrome, partial [Prosthecobacter sp.]|nr:Planctomycete cytochrome [Prosthecobacter sp.]